LNGAEAFGERSTDFGRIFGNDNGAGVDAGASAVVADGADHHVEIIAPVLDAVVADEDLAPAGPVKLDAGIVGVLLGRGFVAEDEGATALAEDCRTAFVIGGIKAKRFARDAGGDEGLE
jgi:hypothetical protein